MNVAHGYPLQARSYQDPYRPATAAEVSSFRNALSEKDVHRPLTMTRVNL